MVIERYVQEDMQNQLRDREQYSLLLKDLPRGKLAVSTSKGIRYFFRIDSDGTRSYLGSEKNPVVQKLQERRLLETAVKRIDQNIPLMKQFLHRYKDPSLPAVSASLPGSYRSACTPRFFSADYIDAHEWEKRPYKRSTRYADNLIHRTQKGDLLRSKSEVIIANILFSRGIAYHYEEVLDVSSGTLAPDFKIAAAGGTQFRYLEHCGMINSSEYRKKMIWKLQVYLDNGFLPWRDVFFTYDNLDGSIDTMAIHKIIDYFFL